MRLKLVALFFLMLLVSMKNVSAQVVINEVVANNSQGISDEDGDYPDWIEFYNPTDSTINLSGYGISDDPDELFKFVFSDFEIQENEYYLVFASDKNRGNNSEVTQKFWETLIRQGDNTKYIIPNSAISSSWIENSFDASSWQNGTFGLGYGDNDDATVVPNGTTSIFTRTSFSIEDLSKINDLLFHIDFDDGYVAYINGVEISRFNMSGNAPIAYDVFSTNFIDDPRLVKGEELEGISIDNYEDILIEGENILAIQIHNSGANSSDLSLIPFLSISRTQKPESSRGIASQINIEGSGIVTAHTNFKLSSEGETLWLTNPDSITIDSISYPNLFIDESYGRSFPDDSSYSIFTTPTPLEANTTEGYSERSPEPKLSLEGGIYPSEFELELLNPELGNITYFTWDGSEPTQNTLQFGLESRTIANSFTLKFRTIESGKLPSKVVTHTYIVGGSHELPIISVSTDPINLWSDESGIYVEGTNGISGNCTGARNWNQDWEIPVNIELFETDGSLGFNSAAGAKIFGGCSRSQDQKSLSFFFRSEYGNPELDYKLFEEKEIDKFQGFVLRNSGNDFNDTQFRDGLMKTLAEGTEIDYQAFRPVVVYLNGEYWGIQNIREKVNEHFLESNSNVESEDVDLAGPFIDEYIFGTEGAFRELYDIINAANMGVSDQYVAIENLVDIDNYIDYMAAQIYYANTDWPGNNIKYWRDGKNNGKWRWIMYDTDFGFNHFNGGNHDSSLGSWENHNTLRFALLSNRNNWPTYPWSTLIFRKFVQNEEFTDKFANRMSDLMNTSFNSQHINAVIDSLSQIIESEIPAHKERWGGSVEQWQGRINILRNFADNRSEKMEGFVMNEFGLSNPSNITVNVSDNLHGSVKVNRISPSVYPWNGRYFGGITIPLSAVPKRGYEFVGWSGASTSLEPTIEGVVGSTYTANFTQRTGNTSEIVINEIMYNSSSENESGDWIELYNSTSSTIDLSGWILKDEDNTHAFEFPNNTKMLPDSYLVISSDLNAFNSQYNNISPVLGDLGFSLSGNSDQVRLFDNVGFLADSLQYDDEDPWDANADGSGFSLELMGSDLDNSFPENWKAAIQEGGTPGSSNSILVVSNEEREDVPSEILLKQNYPNPFNPSTNISFELPNQTKVKLTIFDMLGRKVSVLTDEIRSAGTHTFTWNASEQSSGVYFYRLETGKNVFTKKMLLIK
ncbi:MAG: hypothetical protein BalsKO_01080 [Balneolaceae bacterium]